MFYSVSGLLAGVEGVKGSLTLTEERTAPVAGTTGYGATQPFYRFGWEHVYQVEVKFRSELLSVKVLTVKELWPIQNVSVKAAVAVVGSITTG